MGGLRISRKAYAISDDGRQALMFKSAALRDFFCSRVNGISKCKAAEAYRVRDEEEKDPECCNVSFYDMDILEYWEGDWDVLDEAIKLGIA